MFDAFGAPIHWGLARTTPAGSEPLTLEEAKLHLRETATSNDALIDGLIVSARQHVEAVTARVLLSETWTFTLDTAPAGRAPIVLPLAPVTSVTSITSYSTADASSVVATSVYRLDVSSLPARIVLKDGQDWPSGLRPENALAVAFVVGYTTAADVPELLKLCMKEHVRAAYARDADVELSAGIMQWVNSTLWQFKVFS